MRTCLKKKATLTTESIHRRKNNLNKKDYLMLYMKNNLQRRLNLRLLVLVKSKFNNNSNNNKRKLKRNNLLLRNSVKDKKLLKKLKI